MNKVVLYYIVLYCIVVYCSVLYCSVLYCILLLSGDDQDAMARVKKKRNKAPNKKKKTLQTWYQDLIDLINTKLSDFGNYNVVFSRKLYE